MSYDDTNLRFYEWCTYAFLAGIMAGALVTAYVAIHAKENTPAQMNIDACIRILNEAKEK